MQKSATKKRTKHKINLAKVTGWTMIGLSVALLTASTFYASSISAFIGLGLLFWGITFTYIRTEEYIKKTLLDATASSQLATLNEIMQELDCEGNAIYLPPKYLRDPEACKAYIPKQKEAELPTPEQIQKEETQSFVTFIENPPAALLTPPGAELTKLFEKTLETNFTTADLQYLQKNMPKLFIEDLELAQNFEMETENNKIRVKIENSACSALNKVTEQPANIYSTLGSPLSSAIACTLAKTTGKPIIIENHQTSKDGRDVTIEYRILEEEEQTEE